MVELTIIVSFFGGLIVAISGFIAFGKRIIKWWSNITANYLDYSKLNDDSELKQQFDNQATDISEIKSDINRLVELQEKSYWERQELKADMLTIKIMNGISHDIGAEEIIRLFEEYKCVPKQDGKIRNGYLDWIVSGYATPHDMNINEYYNHENEINKLKTREKLTCKNHELIKK